MQEKLLTLHLSVVSRAFPKKKEALVLYQVKKTHRQPVNRPTLTKSNTANQNGEAAVQIVQCTLNDLPVGRYRTTEYEATTVDRAVEADLDGNEETAPNLDHRVNGRFQEVDPSLYALRDIPKADLCRLDGSKNAPGLPLVVVQEVDPDQNAVELDRQEVLLKEGKLITVQQKLLVIFYLLQEVTVVDLHRLHHYPAMKILQE